MSGHEQNGFELLLVNSEQKWMNGGQGMSNESELKRKLVHIGNGTWILVLAFIPRWLAIMAVLAALFLVLSMNSRMWKKAFDAMAREIDRQLGILVGPLIYVVVVLVLVIFFDVRVAGAAFAMMAFGDGFAGLIGTYKGKHELWKGKSIEGTMSFLFFGFTFSSLSVLLIQQFNPNPAPLFLVELFGIVIPASVVDFLVIMGVVTVMAAVLELFGGSVLDDNALVPLCVAVLLTLWW